MHGMHTTDLARALADAHRSEMAAVFSTNNHASRRLRRTIGLGLVSAGLRMLQTPHDFHWKHVET